MEEKHKIIDVPNTMPSYAMDRGIKKRGENQVNCKPLSGQSERSWLPNLSDKNPARSVVV
jgi:hypothetical protein